MHRHLKKLCQSKILTTVAKIHVNSKNTLCFYVLKNASNITCPTKWLTTWYVCMRLENIFPFLTTNSTRGEIWEFVKI